MNAALEIKQRINENQLSTWARDFSHMLAENIQPKSVVQRIRVRKFKTGGRGWTARFTSDSGASEKPLQHWRD